MEVKSTQNALLIQSEPNQSKGLSTTWISCTQRRFGKDPIAPGKGGEVSMQETVLSKYGNIYSQSITKFAVVPGCTYVLCSKAMDENK